MKITVEMLKCDLCLTRIEFPIADSTLRAWGTLSFYRETGKKQRFFQEEGEKRVEASAPLLEKHTIDICPSCKNSTSTKNLEAMLTTHTQEQPVSIQKFDPTRSW